MIINNTKKLREAITKHPELPLVVIVGSGTCNEDYDMIGSYIDVEIGEFLNYESKISEKAYTDRDEFREDVEDYFWNTFDGNEEEYDVYIEKKLEQYDKYWIKCILLYVSK